MFKFIPSRKKAAIFQSKDTFSSTYLAMKVKLGMMDIQPEIIACPDTGKFMSSKVGCEALSDLLASWAGVALQYLGDGLYFLGERVFESLRNQTEKSFLSYTSVLTNYKSRVWKNARDLDGQRFDAYKLSVVPYDGLVKRIAAVEAIHKALESVNSIYNAPIGNTDDWSTSETEKAINAMERIGYQARHYDFLNTVSKKYAESRKKQPLYLHKYTPKNLLALITRCEKLANYADPKYIDNFEQKYLSCTAKLEEFEEKTATDDLPPVELKRREHESKIRAARLWWLAHFLKATHAVTSDVFSDIEKLALATERCIATPSE